MLSLPDLDDSDIPDIKTLSLEELNKVNCEKLKWLCAIKHCKGTTTVKDYGIFPFIFWRKKWFDCRRYYYLCAKHTRRYKGKVIPEHYFRGKKF